MMVIAFNILILLFAASHRRSKTDMTVRTYAVQTISETVFMVVTIAMTFGRSLPTLPTS